VRHPPRRIVLSLAAAAVLAAGCANVSGGNSDAPEPAKSLSPSISALVKTDVGEYLVRPGKDISSKDVQATIERLRQMPGVQSAELKDGVVDLQFTGGSTREQHEKAVKQLAALGDVYEGI
jgi:hypothetical protein